MPRGPRRRLSSREVEVLCEIAQGRTKSETAKHLGIAPNTVKSHVGNIFDALGARNAAHAVAIGHCRGILSQGKLSVRLPEVSRQEIELLKAVALGMTDVQVGRKLSLSRDRVKAHLRRIYVELGVCSRTQAVDTAFRSGLLVAYPARQQQGVHRPQQLRRMGERAAA
jgi:DNA-binding CsgD family transcriptional regulator